MKIRCFFAVVFLLAMLPMQAIALSCVRPGLVGSFNRHSESDKTYFMAYGKLSGATSLPKRDINSSSTIIPKDITRTLTFNGHGIGKELDAELKNIKIDVTNACLAHWCGGWPPLGKDIVLFIERDNNRKFKFRTNPCGGNYFEGDIRSNISVLRSCLTNGCAQAEKY